MNIRCFMFGKKLLMYTFKNICLQDNEIKLKNDAYKTIINAPLPSKLSLIFVVFMTFFIFNIKAEYSNQNLFFSIIYIILRYPQILHFININ